MRRFVVLICAYLMAVVALPLVSQSGAGAQSPTSTLGPEVMHTSTCLAGNGRVDTNIVNTRAGSADYRVEFEGLTARQRNVASLDWWRQPITGRFDGSYQIVVKRNGVVVSDKEVVVDCDSANPSVTTPEVQIVNSCRAGNGYLLFQFANPRPTRQGYVILFDGVPNRSTSAAAFGGAVRAVTGRPTGTFAYTIRDNASSTIFASGEVEVDCDNPPLTPEVVDGPLPGVGGLQLTGVQLQVRPPLLTENPNAPIRNDSADGQIIFHEPRLDQQQSTPVAVPSGDMCVWYQIRSGSTTLVPAQFGGAERWRQLSCIELPSLQLNPNTEIPFGQNFAINIDTRVGGVGLPSGQYQVHFQPVYFAGGYSPGATGTKMGQVTNTSGTAQTVAITVLSAPGADIGGPDSVLSGELVTFTAASGFASRWAIVPNADDATLTNCRLSANQVAGPQPTLNHSFGAPGQYLVCADLAPIGQTPHWVTTPVVVVPA